MEDSSVASAYLYALVYRLNPDTNVYSLVHGPALVTHEFSPGVLPVERSDVLGWAVENGDRVGVLVPRQCMDGTDGQSMCPSYVNLVVEDGACSSALYSPGVEGVESLVEGVKSLGDLQAGQFEEVLVKLNVEVVIAPIEAGEALTNSMHQG